MAISNRSLERGLAILNCFKPGVSTLSHHELGESAGLPKATLTRLIRTLCEQGYLVSDHRGRGYQLGIPILSLSRALTLSSELVATASPVIHQLASEIRAMIGFGTAHGSDIVYLDGVNRDDSRPNRALGPGMRSPIASTSIGFAYLAGLSRIEREKEINYLRVSLASWGPGTRSRIDQAVQEINDQGYFLMSYNDGGHAVIAAPVVVPGGRVFAFNVSYPVAGGRRSTVPKTMKSALERLIVCVR